MDSGTLNQHSPVAMTAARSVEPDAGGEGPQGPIGAGVAVGADDDVAGPHNPLFREQGMLHPHVAAVVKMGQVLFPGKVSQLLALDGGRDILVGGEVVADQDHPVPVKNLFSPHLMKILDGQGRGDVVAQGDIHPGHDQLAGFHIIFAAVRRENFLGNGLRFGH